jgi:hypothetical protein
MSIINSACTPEGVLDTRNSQGGHSAPGVLEFDRLDEVLVNEDSR